jgi:copper chaperone CopZ
MREIMKNIIVKFALAAIAAVLIFGSSSVNAKENSTLKEVQIKTSAFSFMCKNNIETTLKNTNGVDDSYLSLDDQIVTIKYDPSSVKVEYLQKSIKDLGYDADLVNTVEDEAQIKDNDTGKKKLN